MVTIPSTSTVPRQSVSSDSICEVILATGAKGAKVLWGVLATVAPGRDGGGVVDSAERDDGQISKKADKMYTEKSLSKQSN